MKVSEIIRAIASELSEPDAFKDNWYDYAANQLAHFALGIIAAAMLAQIHFAAFGEFAQKSALWSVIAIFYASFEIFRQGWRGLDTVEDWLFFAAYGAGLPIFLFNEVEVGSPELTINSQVVVPLFMVVLCHLVGGVVSRIIRKNEGP